MGLSNYLTLGDTVEVFVTRPHRKELTMRNKGDHLSSQKEKKISDEVFMVLRKVPSFPPSCLVTLNSMYPD